MHACFRVAVRARVVFGPIRVYSSRLRRPQTAAMPISEASEDSEYSSNASDEEFSGSAGSMDSSGANGFWDDDSEPTSSRSGRDSSRSPSPHPRRPPSKSQDDDEADEQPGDAQPAPDLAAAAPSSNELHEGGRTVTVEGNDKIADVASGETTLGGAVNGNMKSGGCDSEGGDGVDAGGGGGEAAAVAEDDEPVQGISASTYAPTESVSPEGVVASEAGIFAAKAVPAGSGEQAAATRLQAVHRGNRSRRSARRARAAATPSKAVSMGAGESVVLVEGAEQLRAATRIQARHRGRASRRSARERGPKRPRVAAELTPRTEEPLVPAALTRRPELETVDEEEAQPEAEAQTEAGPAEAKVQTEAGPAEAKAQTEAGSAEAKAQTEAGSAEAKAQTEEEVQTEAGSAGAEAQEKAAAKLQAVQRGRSSRRRVKQSRHAAEQRAALLAAEPEEGSAKAEERGKAATRLQAVQRGRASRGKSVQHHHPTLSLEPRRPAAEPEPPTERAKPSTARGSKRTPPGVKMNRLHAATARKREESLPSRRAAETKRARGPQNPLGGSAPPPSKRGVGGPPSPTKGSFGVAGPASPSKGPPSAAGGPPSPSKRCCNASSPTKKLPEGKRRADAHPSTPTDGRDGVDGSSAPTADATPAVTAKSIEAPRRPTYASKVLDARLPIAVIVNTAKAAQVRESKEMGSPLVGEYPPGTEVLLLETAKQPNGRVRARTEHGWVTILTPDNVPFVRTRDEPPNPAADGCAFVNPVRRTPTGFRPVPKVKPVAASRSQRSNRVLSPRETRQRDFASRAYTDGKDLKWITANLLSEATALQTLERSPSPPAAVARASSPPRRLGASSAIEAVQLSPGMRVVHLQHGSGVVTCVYPCPPEVATDFRPAWSTPKHHSNSVMYVVDFDNGQMHRYRADDLAKPSVVEETSVGSRLSDVRRVQEDAKRALSTVGSFFGSIFGRPSDLMSSGAHAVKLTPSQWFERAAKILAQRAADAELAKERATDQARAAAEASKRAAMQVARRQRAEQQDAERRAAGKARMAAALSREKDAIKAAIDGDELCELRAHGPQLLLTDRKKRRPKSAGERRLSRIDMSAVQPAGREPMHCVGGRRPSVETGGAAAGRQRFRGAFWRKVEDDNGMLGQCAVRRGAALLDVSWQGPLSPLRSGFRLTPYD